MQAGYSTTTRRLQDRLQATASRSIVKNVTIEKRTDCAAMRALFSHRRCAIIGTLGIRTWVLALNGEALAAVPSWLRLCAMAKFIRGFRLTSLVSAAQQFIYAIRPIPRLLGGLLRIRICAGKRQSPRKLRTVSEEKRDEFTRHKKRARFLTRPPAGWLKLLIYPTMYGLRSKRFTRAKLRWTGHLISTRSCYFTFF
jgi:hypothetical protein